MLTLIRKLILRSIAGNSISTDEIDLFKSYITKPVLSFSQSGEDMVLRCLLRDMKGGFYVDIGAHHPMRFSNTYYFYLNGWTGINVDPIPGIMDIFNKLRPNDINLEIALGRPGEALFYMFEEGAYNTFDAKIASDLIAKKTSILKLKRKIQKYSLADILDRHLPSGQKINFLAIDAEGMDVEILESNNWEKYTPLYVCAECHTTDESRLMNPKYILESNGYKLVASTEFSSIYKLI